MSKLTTIGLLFSLFLTFSASLQAGVKWHTDMEEAKKAAIDQQKDIFAYFTGSDWCTYCIVLHKQVFDKENFLSNLQKKYILLKLDFPRQKPLGKAEQMKNDQLAKDYSVQGFPTILLLDSKGRAFGRTGYQDMGPKEYAKHIDQLASRKVARDKTFDAARKLVGLKKATALIDALEALGNLPTLQYDDIRQEIFTADPEDKTGYKKNRLLKEKLKGMEAEVINLTETGKADAAMMMIDKFINDYSPQGEDRQKALLFKLYTYSKDSLNFNEVEKLIDSIIAIEPGSETALIARTAKQQVADMRKAQSQK